MTPLVGAFATLGAILTADSPIVIQVLVGAAAGLIGLFLGVTLIAFVFLMKAIPTVREENRRSAETRKRRVQELEDKLAKPQIAYAAIEEHQIALSELFRRAEAAQRYPRPHGLADPVNEEFAAIRETLTDFNDGHNGRTFENQTVTEDMSAEDVRDLIDQGRKQLDEISLSLRRVLRILNA